MVYQVVNPEEKIESSDPQKAKEAQDAAGAFRDQMTELTNRLKRHFAGDDQSEANFTTLKDKGESLTDRLNKQYDAAKRREDDLKRALARLEGRKFPTKAGVELNGILTERGVPVDRLQTMLGIRVGQEGYVWRWYKPPVNGKGVAQVTIAAFLSRSEALQLVGLLAKVLESPDPLASLREAVGKDKTSSFEHAVLTPLGLPANPSAFILRRSVDSLTPELLQVEIPVVRERLKSLRSLASPNGPASRWFRLSGGTTEWCWVDVETELP